MVRVGLSYRSRSIERLDGAKLEPEKVFTKNGFRQRAGSVRSEPIKGGHYLFQVVNLCRWSRLPFYAYKANRRFIGTTVQGSKTVWP